MAIAPYPVPTSLDEWAGCTRRKFLDNCFHQQFGFRPRELKLTDPHKTAGRKILFLRPNRQWVPPHFSSQPVFRISLDRSGRHDFLALTNIRAARSTWRNVSQEKFRGKTGVVWAPWQKVFRGFVEKFFPGFQNGLRRGSFRLLTFQSGSECEGRSRSLRDPLP